jgi:hypothetical protein
MRRASSSLRGSSPAAFRASVSSVVRPTAHHSSDRRSDKWPNLMKFIRRVMQLAAALAVLLCVIVFMPHACYRLTHWPPLLNPDSLIAFADKEFAKGLDPKNPAGEIAPANWPPEILNPSPKWVLVLDDRLDIILHSGGALAGNTGFWIIKNGATNPTGGKRDKIYSGSNPRMFKYDLEY